MLPSAPVAQFTKPPVHACLLLGPHPLQFQVMSLGAATAAAPLAGTYSGIVPVVFPHLSVLPDGGDTLLLVAVLGVGALLTAGFDCPYERPVYTAGEVPTGADVMIRSLTSPPLLPVAAAKVALKDSQGEVLFACALLTLHESSYKSEAPLAGQRRCPYPPECHPAACCGRSARACSRAAAWEA